MDPGSYVIIPPRPPVPTIPQGDGPISTPLSMSPLTSAETSLNSETSANSTIRGGEQVCTYFGARPKTLPTTLPFHSTPLPTDDDTFKFKLPGIAAEVIYHRDQTPGVSMSPREHMRFLRRAYFPTRDELDGPVVRYSKLHYGDEEDNISVLETAFVDSPDEPPVDDDVQAVPDGAAGGFSNRFRNLNPFRRR